MSVKIESFPELYRRAYAILSREMGVLETIRFFGQLGLGAGNYTEERRALFESLTLDEYRQAILQKTEGTSPP